MLSTFHTLLKRVLENISFVKKKGYYNKKTEKYGKLSLKNMVNHISQKYGKMSLQIWNDHLQ
jgi:hypothetical protein